MVGLVKRSSDPSTPANPGTGIFRMFSVALVILLATPSVIAEAPQDNDKWLEPARSRLMEEKNGLPFFPHRANTPNNVLLSTKDFDDAQVCGACHTEIYQQWLEQE